MREYGKAGKEIDPTGVDTNLKSRDSMNKEEVNLSIWYHRVLL